MIHRGRYAWLGTYDINPKLIHEAVAKMCPNKQHFLGENWLIRRPTMNADITLENSNAENTIPISVSLAPFPFASGGKKGIKNVSVVIAINCTVRTTNVRVLSFHGEFMDGSRKYLSIADTNVVN